MTRLEERLKDALLASAGRVQDNRLRPFPDLEPGTGHRSRLNQAWLVPVAAAASVVLVIGLVLAVTGGLRQAASPAAGRPDVTAANVPKYSVTIKPDGLGLVYVAVYSTSNGALIAKVRTPAPPHLSLAAYGVAAGPDDRTFYVEYLAYSHNVHQIWIYTFSVTGSGSATPLTRVKGGVVNGSPGLAEQGIFAVSPEGTKLLVTSDTTNSGKFNEQGYSERIIVIDLLTGKQSTWQGGMYRAGKAFTVQDVSWSANGQSIVFLAQWCTSPSTNPCTAAYGPDKGRDAQVRSLSVASGGGTLDSGSLLLKQSAEYPVIAAAIAGPDGSDITAVVLAGQVNSIEHISAVSGSLIGVDYRTSRPHEPEGTQDYVSLTADPSGRYLLFYYKDGSGFNIGWIGRGAFHLLPGGQNPGPWIQAW